VLIKNQKKLNNKFYFFLNEDEMKRKYLLMLLTTLSLSANILQNTNCINCHGKHFEKSALNQSKIVKDMTQNEIEKALIGYKLGTYGKGLKGIMKGQLLKFNENELKIIAKYIKEKYL